MRKHIAYSLFLKLIWDLLRMQMSLSFSGIIMLAFGELDGMSI